MQSNSRAAESCIYVSSEILLSHRDCCRILALISVLLFFTSYRRCAWLLVKIGQEFFFPLFSLCRGCSLLPRLHIDECMKLTVEKLTKTALTLHGFRLSVSPHFHDSWQNKNYNSSSNNKNTVLHKRASTLQVFNKQTNNQKNKKQNKTMLHCLVFYYYLYGILL